MATQFTPPPHRKIYQYVVWDQHGNPVLAMDSGGQFLEVGRDGIREAHIAGALILPNGTAWHPAMARGPTPIHLAVCSHCGEITTQNHGAWCASCNVFVCASHRRWGDGAWRCVDCATRRTLTDILLWPFFRREGG